jgi:hypothetical protein
VKLRTEAPVNGGRNYNGPKVNDSLALVKSGYLLETLSIPRYANVSSRENALGADNQQERSVRFTNLSGSWKGTIPVVP